MSETEIQDSDKKVNVGKKAEDNPVADSSSFSKERKRSPKRKGPKFNRNDKKNKLSTCFFSIWLTISRTLHEVKNLVVCIWFKADLS